MDRMLQIDILTIPPPHPFGKLRTGSNLSPIKGEGIFALTLILSHRERGLI